MSKSQKNLTKPKYLSKKALLFITYMKGIHTVIIYDTGISE